MKSNSRTQAKETPRSSANRIQLVHALADAPPFHGRDFAEPTANRHNRRGHHRYRQPCHAENAVQATNTATKAVYKGITSVTGEYPISQLPAGAARLHVVERYRRPDLGHLELDLTVEDLSALKGPWRLKRNYSLNPTEEVVESLCNENEKDAVHIK